MAGGRGRSRGGRRSNEPTSHGVVPTRAPSCFFLLLSRCLRVPRSLDFSLFLPPYSRPSSFLRLYYSYFHAHVLRLCGSTIYVPADLLCACYHTAGPATDRDALQNCSTESCIANRPTYCFRIDYKDPSRS